MKSVLVVAAVLLGSTAAVSARAPGLHAPAWSPVGTWRFGLLTRSGLPQNRSDAIQTLTGGPSGGPSQS